MLNEEFIKEFVEEALEHIAAMEEGLLKLERGEWDKSVISGLFRAVHSIKGTAGFFALKNIVSLSHTMENMLGEYRAERLSPTPPMVDALLFANDLLKSMISDPHNSDQIDVSSAIDRLNQSMKAPPQSSVTLKDSLRHGHKVYHLRFSLTQGLPNVTPIKFFKDLNSIGHVLWVETNMGDISNLKDSLAVEISAQVLFSTVLDKDMVEQALGLPGLYLVEVEAKGITDIKELIAAALSTESKPLSSTTPPSAPTIEKKPTPAEESVRVSVGLLNKLLNLASEMVLGRNQLLRLTQSVRKSIPGLDQVLQDVDHITTEMQESIMQTRMQPLQSIFNKFPRIVRDLSRSLDKKAQLLVEGAAVELDKSIIEGLTDPLTHLVRNALDHGLEKPHVRKAAGKPEQGTITLRAYHEGGKVNIDISDDGGGIDVARVKAKAMANGLITEQQAANMPEGELVQLIFHAGLSTAEKVSDVSGRGVGMDVVKTNIERLGGTVTVMTQRGEGTTIRLVLPLTVAIVSALIVEVENQCFAIPQVNIKSIVRVTPKDTSKRVDFVDNSPVLNLRGSLIPVVDFAALLGFPDRLVNNVLPFPIKKARAEVAASMEPFEPQRSPGVQRILMISTGQNMYGLLVDKIHGSEEVLVKPLPKYISGCHTFSGATIMGDGKVALILDPDGIADQAGLRFRETSRRVVRAVTQKRVERRGLLIFKCSGPERYAVDLSNIARVEKIHANQIESVGDRQFVKLAEQVLTLVRPEDYLPVTSRPTTASSLYVIVPKNKRVGFLVEELNDTYEDELVLDTESITAIGLHGSITVKERLVLVISIDDVLALAQQKASRQVGGVL